MSKRRGAQSQRPQEHDPLSRFRAGWERRFGERNPHRMDVPFWVEMVRRGITGWTARRELGLENSDDFSPTWCFDRFGSTRTRLPDGRVICVAGEHEDHYDPDFCIYNDVVVFEPGGGIAIYGYPERVFPPTDFHTATLIDEHLWLIGSLGYLAEREQRSACQVCRLNIHTFQFQLVETRGEDPGWLSRHRARLINGGSTIRVWGGVMVRGNESTENTGTFDFEIATGRWRSVEALAPASELRSQPAVVSRLRSVSPSEQWDVMDLIRRTTPPGHRLFGAELWPVAIDQETQTAVAPIDDGTNRWVLCETPWAEPRCELPRPHTRCFEDFHHLLRTLPDLSWDSWCDG